MTAFDARLGRACAGALAAGLLAVLPVRADVTLRGRQTVRTGQAVPMSAAATLFYQGANTRLEIAGSPALVYDGKANILYGVNTARRSYYLSVPAPVDPADEVSLDADEIKVETKLDLHQTGQMRVLAGLAAHQYTLTGSVIYTRLHPGRIHAENDSAEAREQEGRRKRIAAYLPPLWRIGGELWLADTAHFPSKENTLPAVLLAAVAAGPFGDPLEDALEKRGGLPLLAQITVTHAPPVLNAAPMATQTNWTALSVSEAPLDEKLFKAPPEYALVTAPH